MNNGTIFKLLGNFNLPNGHKGEIKKPKSYKYLKNGSINKLENNSGPSDLQSESYKANPSINQMF